MRHLHLELPLRGERVLRLGLAADGADRFAAVQDIPEVLGHLVPGLAHDLVHRVRGPTSGHRHADREGSADVRREHRDAREGEKHLRHRGVGPGRLRVQRQNGDADRERDAVRALQRRPHELRALLAGRAGPTRPGPRPGRQGPAERPDARGRGAAELLQRAGGVPHRAGRRGDRVLRRVSRRGGPRGGREGRRLRPRGPGGHRRGRGAPRPGARLLASGERVAPRPRVQLGSQAHERHRRHCGRRGLRADEGLRQRHGGFDVRAVASRGTRRVVGVLPAGLAHVGGGQAADVGSGLRHVAVDVGRGRQRDGGPGGEVGCRRCARRGQPQVLGRHGLGGPVAGQCSHDDRRHAKDRAPGLGAHGRQGRDSHRDRKVVQAHRRQHELGDSRWRRVSGRVHADLEGGAGNEVERHATRAGHGLGRPVCEPHLVG
mmetsp:Transcript_127875/g.357992  ORF Transcript_127875/g.357992 Transcript_127875/m.357992 type:complete len:432 (+) Transcript_127875:1017-2312(+)